MSTQVSRLSPFLNTVVLGGAPQRKLAAARAAGFAAVELWHHDVATALGGAAGAREALAAEGLAAADYQVLLDFDGAAPAQREAKRAEAIALLNAMQNLGCRLLVVSANTAEDALGNLHAIEDDLAWLAEMAASRHIGLAYEPLAWSRWVSTLNEAADLVARLDLPNLGLVVDAFHHLIRNRGIEELEQLPADKVVLLQLSDTDVHETERDLSAAGYRDLARTRRLFPGEGILPLAELLATLKQIGVTAPIGLEVFNERYAAADPFETAQRARDSLRALGL